MKKIIKPQINGAYALLNEDENQYSVYNSKGLLIGYIKPDSDLIITCTKSSQTQLSYTDLKSLEDILIECEVEFALGLFFVS